MRTRRTLATAVAFAFASVFAGGSASSSPQPESDAAVERAFEKFWKASNAGAAARAIPAILATGIDYETARARLRAGPTYASDAPTGELTHTNMVAAAGPLPYTFVVPADYSPAESLPVVFFLHGGVNRQPTDEPRRGPRRRLELGLRHITVYPSANAEAKWWHRNQVENLQAILDRLKRTYRVDTNRVHVMGVSDGGTGAYFLALRETTAWASFLPLNGSLRVLSKPDAAADGPLFARNLALKPFYVVNGGRDPLYPLPVVVPVVDLMRRAGCSVTFRPQAEAGHDTSWWPRLQDDAAAFLRDHARDPLPDRISWETEQTDRYNRAHWLVIDALAREPLAGDATFEDFNQLPPLRPRAFGVRFTKDAGPARVAEIDKGSDAASLGLQRGDVVVELLGQPIASADAFWTALGGYQLGTRLSLVVERHGRRLPLEEIFQPPPLESLFSRSRRSGRIDLARKGNLVEVLSRGVAEYTLLISPDEFDLAQPIRVTTNGAVSFEGRVEPSLETLLTWAARDSDPQMLFTAQLRIVVAPPPRR